MTYGQIIPNLKIDSEEVNYPVVNEREIRAVAGLMLLIGILAFAYIYFTRDYTPLYIVVPLFWLEFFVKTVFAPHYSLFGKIASPLVKNQKPEYVGAIQKRFAWGLGLIMATAMLIVSIGLGIKGILPFTICLTCLALMWMETALGICVGCKIYSFLLSKKILPEPAIKPACPGGACKIRN